MYIYILSCIYIYSNPRKDRTVIYRHVRWTLFFSLFGSCNFPSISVADVDKRHPKPNGDTFSPGATWEE